jgi:hypothetical protein
VDFLAESSDLQAAIIVRNGLLCDCHSELYVEGGMKENGVWFPLDTAAPAL